VLALLTTGTVRHAGKYFSLEGTRLEIAPYQRPYPPLWYPTSNPDSVAAIAEQGYQLLLSFNTPTLDETRRRLAIYKRHLPRAASNPNRVNSHVTAPRFGIVRKVLVADTDAEAFRIAREALPAFRDNFTFLWEMHGVHSYTTNLEHLDDCLDRGVLFAGSPTTVARTLGSFLDACGANYFAGCFTWGLINNQQALRSLALFTEQVIPALQAFKAAA
jgi:alkanesulfonate monooxygenase SsuD/methylene tetrahydromethanopterin reductase-like flavin-dependent oxidoreductase (luciferase family)